MSETEGSGTLEDRADETEPTRTVSDLRRSAAAQDVLLFCVAFSGGAVLYVLGHLLLAADSLGWEAGLSDDLLLSGLIAGELFILWNNGLRQGVRGHSIGKHRSGLRVVSEGSQRPVGAVHGLARGLVVVGLFDLALAAVPIGLPTVLRRLTPDQWHVGGAAYVAVLLIVVSLLPFARTVPDLLLRTRVVRSEDRTSPRRRRALVVLDVVGVLGVLAVCLTYLAFFWPLIWQVPSLR